VASITHPRVTHPRISRTQYVAIQLDAGWTAPLELIDGEAVVIPPTGGQASRAQIELIHALRGWQDRTADRGLLLQDVFVELPGGEYPAPDIAWWTAGRVPVVGFGAVSSVPDLVGEVLSPSTEANDRGPKREAYATAGVRELWLVDPRTRDITVYRDPELAAPVTLGRADELTSELLPGFAAKVGELLPVV
jgi:Uma2 family endonuclease